MSEPVKETTEQVDQQVANTSEQVETQAQNAETKVEETAKDGEHKAEETATATEGEAKKAEETVEGESSGVAANVAKTVDQVLDKADGAAPDAIKKQAWYKKVVGGLKKLVKSVNK